MRDALLEAGAHRFFNWHDSSSQRMGKNFIHNNSNKPTKIMNPETNRIQHGADEMTDDARDLISATADVADKTVVETRNRLSGAIDAAKQTLTTVQKRTVETAKATDKKIRDNPYQAIGIAFGIGALVGFLISRRDK
jgi:ElaB/YqjD/DUF883 family membrane-anchored ribosome-binding protein